MSNVDYPTSQGLRLVRAFFSIDDYSIREEIVSYVERHADQYKKSGGRPEKKQ